MAKDHNISQGSSASPCPSPIISAKRDQQGRFAERTIRLGGRLGDSTETRRYAYDSAGRLSRVTDEHGALRESYQYDHQGRRLADINPARFRGERRYSYLSGNRLGQAGSVQYGHDRAGFRNLKVEATPQGQRETHYRYEPSGLLLAVDLPGGKRIHYAYDASGQRTEKHVTVNGVRRIVEAFRWLDPLRLSEFHDGQQWWMFAYLEGRTPIGLTNGEDMYFLLADQVGTPLALATTDGRIVQTMQYDSFGNLLQVRGNAVRLPLGFAGGLHDPDTGLTRFVWRDYDADTGRFTALDPLGKKGGDTDWYGYCVDDPVNRMDMWGLWSIGGIDFGGDGRPPWQPRYGNWGGQDWSGGQNPKRHGGADGELPPVDSSDEVYKRHDEAWGRCDNEDILANDPGKWRRDCKREADKDLVEGLGRLPDDPTQWKIPPAPGDEKSAQTFGGWAKGWFEW